MNFIARGVVSLVFVGLGSTLVHAGMTATAQQVGNDVVFNVSGTLDVSELQPFFANSVTANANLSPTSIVRFNAGAPVAPGGVFVYVARTPDVLINGPASYGTGTNVAANSGTGDYTGFELVSSYGPTSGLGGIILPTNYVSGSPLAGTATYNNHTLATLGITPGVYTWTWPTAAGSDFYTLVVPEPASLSLLALAGMLLRRQRSR